MKRFVLTVLAFLGIAGLAAAQSATLSFDTFPGTTNHNLAPAANGLRLVADATGDTIAVPAAPDPQPAAPQPTPRFYFGNSDDFRFQLGLGYQYFRFRSSQFNSNMSGVQTSLSYFLNDWFAVEGNTVAEFGSRAFGDRSKSLLYTAGGRIAWREEKRKWEPWMHALVGGIHMLPQTAAGGQNGFALQAGGGADYRLTSNVSLRVGGDYVRTHLYSQSQNNFQGGAGIVVHF